MIDGLLNNSLSNKKLISPHMELTNRNLLILFNKRKINSFNDNIVNTTSELLSICRTNMFSIPKHNFCIKNPLVIFKQQN